MKTADEKKIQDYLKSHVTPFWAGVCFKHLRLGSNGNDWCAVNLTRPKLTIERAASEVMVKTLTFTCDIITADSKGKGKLTYRAPNTRHGHTVVVQK